MEVPLVIAIAAGAASRAVKTRAAIEQLGKLWPELQLRSAREPYRRSTHSATHGCRVAATTMPGHHTRHRGDRVVRMDELILEARHIRSD
jgi:hypothetical protein